MIGSRETTLEETNSDAQQKEDERFHGRSPRPFDRNFK